MGYCSVPGCEKINKGNNKRFFFGFPKKEELLQKWLEAIPSLERPIKSSRRVCQYHFEPKDILKTFSHTIGGKEYLIERERGRLKPNAVPTKHLGNISTVNRKITSKSGKTVRKIGTIDNDEIISDINGETSRVPETVELLQVEQICKEKNLIIYSHRIRRSESEIHENAYEDTPLHCDDFTIADDCSSRSNVRNKVDILQDQEIAGSNLNAYLTKNQTKSPTLTASESFDLFDNVFEVVLPTTLWGVHRSPNQNRIMFVCIDEEQLNVNKMLTVNDTGEIKIYIAMQLTREECWPTEDLTPERISDLLQELDVMQICVGATSSENCEIVLKDIDSGEQSRQRLCTRCS